LKQLSEAIQPVEAVIDEMRAEHDALALHIFIARQSKDTKSGKRRDTTALLSFHKACDLGRRSRPCIHCGAAAFLRLAVGAVRLSGAAELYHSGGSVSLLEAGFAQEWVCGSSFDSRAN